MAKAQGNGNGGAAAKVEDKPAASESEDTGEGYSIESIMDFTMDQLASMDDVLAGKKKLGRNMALMGFFQKAPEAQLVGVVRRCKEQTNRIDPSNTDLILYIEGKAKYPKDVIDPDDGKVKVKAGEYQALFAFQLDSATGAFWGEDIIGSRVHFHVKQMEKLPSGLKRYAYHRAGLLPARVGGVDW
jgi:hypothetical protein